ncbi:MAG TPA: hypothetical protein VFQ53_05300 [Kofleriaceae bacterium]|nr:hypothetical protein [Kofleriaceae bacterium]
MYPIITNDFPHGGEHLSNDDKQAHWMMLLLGIFAVFAVYIIIMAVRAA